MLLARAGGATRPWQAEAQEASSVEPINAWAARVTRGLITTAVPPGTPFDVVLTNAVYFKGLWEFAFKKEATRKQAFALEGPNSGSVEVDMMSRAFKASDRASSPERRVLYAEGAGYQAVRLPYRGTSVSAVAVLPSRELAAAGGVATALTQLDVGELVGLSKFRPVGPGGLEVQLPRFTVKSECVSLKEPLLRMGLSSAFNPEAADFSGISEQPLFITDVLQSVCVIVDEEGTEAAAVTAVTMMRCAAVMLPPTVVCFDRPFAFLLVDDATGTPLFVGVVTNPAAGVPAAS